MVGDAKRHGFRTRSVHLGQDPDPRTGAIVPPLDVASTYVQPSAGEWGEYDYSRSGNPGRAGLEAALADLEGGVRGLAFASGMAATHTATMLLKPGDQVVAGTEIYGGTYRLLHRVCNQLGIETTQAPSTDLDAFAAIGSDGLERVGSRQQFVEFERTVVTRETAMHGTTFECTTGAGGGAIEDSHPPTRASISLLVQDAPSDRESGSADHDFERRGNCARKLVSTCVEGRGW